MSLIKPSPLVQKFFLKLPPPSLNDNTAEMDRVRRALKTEQGFENLSLPLALIPEWVSLLRTARYQATATVAITPLLPRLIHLEPGDTSQRNFGLAVDLGTTRMAFQLWDLHQGRLLEEADSENPQVRFGPDILTRIQWAEVPEKRRELQADVVSEINRMAAHMGRAHQVLPRDIFALSLAGNTTMTHFFLGLDPTSIRREPYIPVVNAVEPLLARDLDIAIHPQALIYVFPNVGSYLGGDVLAGILASRLHQQPDLSLLVDVGTNAEVVFGNADWLLGCAGAAGPALEGGVAQMGMTAGEGAIERVRLDPVTREPDYGVIGRGQPKGICGSGLIDLVAEMFLAGLIDLRGKFNLKLADRRWVQVDGQPAYQLVPAAETPDNRPIVLTQVDLDILLRSKAAMYTILTTLVESLGYALSDIRRFFVAGAFGNHIDPRRAIVLGMLPDLPLERYIPLGNTSLKGAAAALLDQGLLEEVKKIAGKITYMEMNVNQDFMNRFSAARFIPHTDSSLFPSVKRPG